MTLTSLQYVEDLVGRYEDDAGFEKITPHRIAPMPVSSTIAARRATRRGKSRRARIRQGNPRRIVS